MNQALTAAIQEAYAIAPASVSVLQTLEIRHASMSEPLYFVQGFLNREMTLETGQTVVFNACAFDFKLPPTDESGLQEMEITFDNTDNRVSDFCEQAMVFPTPAEIYYRPYLSNDLTEPQMDPPLRLFLLDVKVSESQLSGRCAPADFLNMKFPREHYDAGRFPRL